MVTEHDRGFTEERRRHHRQECARASTERLLVLPGIEYSDASNVVHVLTWGDVPFIGEARPTDEMLEAVRASDGVAVLAHPTRRKAWQAYDPRWTKHLLGIELWNRKTDGWSPSRTAVPLLKATGLRPFAGLDFHDRQFFPLTMTLDVSGPVCEGSVLTALRSGHFSASAFGVGITTDSVALRFGALRLPEFTRRAWSWGRKRALKLSGERNRKRRTSGGEAAEKHESADLLS
jgi:hypothetical protein